MRYNVVEKNGFTTFYREAGDPNKPVFLLLHGFPSASHYFRKLMPILAKHFHVIAPDLPGFGQTIEPDSFIYSFDNLVNFIEAFTEELDLKHFYLYVFDYSVPIGFEFATRHPDAINGIVVQNGTIYVEGLGELFTELKDYWANPTPAKRRRYENAYSDGIIRHYYEIGEKPGSISPDGWALDEFYSLRHSNFAHAQNDLIFDFRSNLMNYQRMQDYVRHYQPRVLAIFGKNDPAYTMPGAYALAKDDKNAQVFPIDGGHFALEAHSPEIGEIIIREFVSPEAGDAVHRTALALGEAAES